MQAIYTAGDIEEIAYGIHDLHNLFQTWAAVGEGIQSIRQGDYCQEMATMFSLAFDQAKELNAELEKLDKLADERRDTAQQTIPTPPPFLPNTSPRATLPSGGVYQDEPAEWRCRLWRWSDAINGAMNRLHGVSQTLELVENGAKDDGHHGPVALAHNCLLEAMGELRSLQAEISLFHGDDDAPVVGGDGQEEAAGEDPAPQPVLRTKADLFPEALARYRSAAALRERLRHAYGTEEADAAIDHEGSRYRAAMLTEAVTVADVLAKLELFEDYRCDDGGSMDRQIEAEILAAFDDVRNVLEAASLEPSPAFAARVQAWRTANDTYFAEDKRDDATVDPLFRVKMDAYDAMLAEPVQTLGDLLAMVRTIKDEDNLGTEGATYYEPAFDALLAAVESLAGGGSEQ